jgi:hypothetical protein
MPKVKQHKARTDIYDNGVRIPDESTKSGYRIDRSQPRDENDTLFCKAGTTYYSWGMMVGGRGVQRKSLTPPRRSQLTNSDFLGQIYDLEDNLDFGSCDSPESLRDARDEIAQQLRDLGQEQQDKFDNMPDGLQQGDTGQLIETRAQSCDDIASAFEDVDLEYEDPGAEEIAEIEAKVNGLKQEKLDEWLGKKRGELEDVSWDYE